MARPIQPQLVANPEVAFHRNGVCGASFHVVAFDGAPGSDVAGRRFVATVFAEDGHVAVLSLGGVYDGAGQRIADGAPNVDDAWRGDHFESELRAAIAKHQRAEEARRKRTAARS